MPELWLQSGGQFTQDLEYLSMESELTTNGPFLLLPPCLMPTLDMLCTKLFSIPRTQHALTSQALHELFLGPGTPPELPSSPAPHLSISYLADFPPRPTHPSGPSLGAFFSREPSLTLPGLGPATPPLCPRRPWPCSPIALTAQYCDFLFGRVPDKPGNSGSAPVLFPIKSPLSKMAVINTSEINE